MKVKAISQLSFTALFAVTPSTTAFTPNLQTKNARVSKLMAQSENHINSGEPTSPKTRRNFFGAAIASSLTTYGCFTENSNAAVEIGGKIKYGDESIMSKKEHGTTTEAVQPNLRYGVSQKIADRICSYNRMFAENAGYYLDTTFRDTMMQASVDKSGPITFYDSVSGKPLFVAPIGRSVEDFLLESQYHGWPSFRDEEVVWDNARVLRPSGEMVSVDGTHLGHNIPDRRGNRYCINLVSIAGNPVA